MEPLEPTETIRVPLVQLWNNKKMAQSAVPASLQNRHDGSMIMTTIASITVGDEHNSKFREASADRQFTAVAAVGHETSEIFEVLLQSI